MTSNQTKEEPKLLDLTQGSRLTNLEWQNLIEEMEALSDQKDAEPFKERAIRKMKEQPLVPLGALATTTCLCMGLLNLYKGNKQRQQFFMRGRVAAQGFTIAVVAFALLSTLAKPASKK